MKKGIITKNKINQPVYPTYSETDLYLLQEKISDHLTKQFKKGNGVFFTPPEIITQLITLADISIGDKILDPACAVGQFLYYIVDRLIFEGKRKGLQNSELSKIISQSIYGMDINDEFVKECKKLLSDRIYKLLGVKIKLKISKKDFLSVSPKKSFDVVIGNPPYGIPGYDPHYPIRLTREQKERYKNFFKTWKGKYNLYALFVEQGLNLLKKGGRLCFIIPATFMILDEFKKFRKYLSLVGKVEIEYLGRSVFKDAQVSTVLLKVTKGERGLVLKDSNGYCHKKESYQGELIRFEDDFTRTLEKKAPYKLGDFFDIHISARSPEVKSNPYVLIPKDKDQKNWSSQKLAFVSNSSQTPPKDFFKNYLPILNGRNLKPFKIDYKTNFSGYWIKSDKVGTLKKFYLEDRIAVGHTKGGKVVAAVDYKKYPWISDVYFLIPKKDLPLLITSSKVKLTPKEPEPLATLPKAFAREKGDNWYIRCPECKTKIELEECPVPGGMAANIETCPECGIDIAVYPPKVKSIPPAPKAKPLSLEEITYILNSPLMQRFMKTLYRDITPHTTLTQLKEIPIYPIEEWKKLEEEYGKPF